ncbi:diacylglycerol/lipid kinase family protein [Rhodosalinus sp.]|uniref:diacylglycerol/lipid kinase family protein n=1 Tax=Rhodosalinus sp. TaxID=2047741 RepID=UPI00356720FD
MAAPEGPLAPSTATIVLNPVSGGGGDRAAWLGALFDAAGMPVGIIETRPGRNARDAARIALARGARTLVAAGGDGTASDVADALCAASRTARLGVLPLGTFNHFARGMGLPLDTEAAVATIARGTTRRIRPGQVNGRTFLNNMSLGLYPEILARREGLYAALGRSRAAAYLSVARALAQRQRPMHLSVGLDGRARRLRTPLLFVAASAHQLETRDLDGASAVRAGAFAVFAARGHRRRDLARTAFHLALGAARPGRDFALSTARRITVATGRRRTLVARDGEREWMRTPLRIGPAQRALDVIVPGMQG